MVYNPVGRQDEAIVVRVPVTTDKLAVMDANSKTVTCQVRSHEPMLSIRDYVDR